MTWNAKMQLKLLSYKLEHHLISNFRYHVLKVMLTTTT